MAVDKVTRGQSITQAQMNALAAEAVSKTGKPFVFPVPVIWQVATREDMLNFHMADFGVALGGIVIIFDERKVYQLMPLKIVETGVDARKSWEIEENWEEQTNWHLVDAIYGQLVGDWPRNLTTITNGAVGDYAAVISTRMFAGSPTSPRFFRLWATPSNVLANWHYLGGGLEWTNADSFGQGAAGQPPPAPIWRQQIRAIQTQALRKISDSQGRPYKSYCHGQRKVPVLSVNTRTPGLDLRAAVGLPTTQTESVLWVNRLGAPLSTLPPTAPDNLNYIRLFKEVEYYARGPSEVWMYCTVTGVINWMQGAVLNGSPGAPSGVDLDFRFFNEVDVDYIAREVNFRVDVGVTQQGTDPQWSWVDSTGVGGVLPDIAGNPRDNGPNYGTVTPGSQVTSWKAWNGGSFRVGASISGPGVTGVTGVNYTIQYRAKCNIIRTTIAKHKTAEVRRGRLPDLAIEANGVATPVGNKIEIGRIGFVAVSGDLQGCFLAKPAATFPIVSGPVGGGELKYPWGFTSVPPDPPVFTMLPYPIYKWTGTPVANPTVWPGVDAPGNGMVFDIYATRPSAPQTSQNVPIGVNRGGQFSQIASVVIPAGQKGARMTSPTALQQFVLMDNEPLYYFELGGVVSTVQVMVIPRRVMPVGPTGIYDFGGAQMGFADDYNATVDFLADI